MLFTVDTLKCFIFALVAITDIHCHADEYLNSVFWDVFVRLVTLQRICHFIVSDCRWSVNTFDVALLSGIVNMCRMPESRSEELLNYAKCG